MKDKKLVLQILIIIFVIGAAIFATIYYFSSIEEKTKPQETTVKKVLSIISADGTITAQNQATLHFQTAGKLIYLPLKQGDKVYQGQTIAQLDTYALQRNLQIAANSYQISKNSDDQTLENNQAGVVEGQQRVTLDKSTTNAYTVNATEAQIITDTVKKFVDNSKLAKDSAQLNVDLANYAIQLATITSPLTGIVTHEDVTVAGVNVTATTSFTVADPTSIVFRANIAENDIDYISEGAGATISIDGSSKKVKGIVSKIYPAKVTLSTGQTVYQVDIQSDDLKTAKFDQTGSVLIDSNTDSAVTLVPMWTVLGGKFIWVENNGQTVLREVKVGRIHGTNIEILNGLNNDDKVITDPKTITSKKYLVL